jgi:uncharacterized protein (TIGR00730 family)
MTSDQTSLKTICVYCGASPSTSEKYIRVAERTGEALAQAGMQIVYGGGRSGLMGTVADSALKAGGQVIGIIPDHIDEREIRHEELTELHITHSMHERKQMMAAKADMFLILPGGLGTMDEFFEILTWRQLGLHNKPIIILNEENYWTPLVDLISHIQEERFMKPQDRDLFAVYNNLDELIDSLKKMSVSSENVKQDYL